MKKEQVLDTIQKGKEIIPIKIISEPKFDWEPYVLLIATLSLIAAVIIPFAQKWYEEYRTKRSFQFYFKKQLGIILNLITSEKIEYISPGIKDNPEKVFLSPSEFSKKLEVDFKNNKEAVQPKTIFILLMNLQKMMHYSYQLRYALSKIEFDKLTDKTLEHGKELSNKELQKAYGIILIYESFISISTFHDRFGDMKSIQREIRDKIWIGLKLEKDFLQKQSVLNDDLQLINNHENSIFEITEMIRIVETKTKEYFEYEKNQKKRNKGYS
ncbi:hypothetical protein G6N05_15215 [Flavobacterium sp. F372]|uniref:DUF4129 domain-containing protein n=1 Tax=Flavobacterium bernardetii TaxID=2813823 RepID=A0ABR7J2B7_9FLAO|nr:hypothetical protein [Flavobacterium bernardetii]MBC5836230.1 hypothetical protein [Flavobacterium bernardetii]NHF71462.1 hypothetical protein [Flavobacterium bernardetii]